jgi:hypothetical protein
MNEINVKKLKMSFLYPINTHVSKLFLIKLKNRIQSPLSIYCLSSFSFSLLVCLVFNFQQIGIRVQLIDPRKMANSTFPKTILIIGAFV